MKTAVAYFLIIFSVPAIIGLAASAIIQIPLAKLATKERASPESLIWQSLEVISGFVAMLVAFLIFELLSARVSILIPVILGCWISVYYYSFSQPRWEWASWLIGIAVGWLVLPLNILG